MGCVSQVGEQALNVGRMSALVAGWPETVCGSSVDRQCGSSMQAAFNAAAASRPGTSTSSSPPGVESMSRVPMGSNLTTDGLRGLLAAALRALGDRPAGDLGRGDRRRVGSLARGSRRVLVESHRRAIAAIDEGRFEREIVPVEVGAAGAAVLVAVDENPRRDTSLEKLASLAPGVQGGRQGDRRQLERDRRRRRRDARRERGRASAGSGSSRAAGSSRSGSQASTRTGCCTATPRRASGRSRKPGSAGTTWR